ncbi:MAG: response regulator [Candidatus Thorarchaeota archaeon]
MIRVLLVDDDQDLLMIAEKFLTQYEEDFRVTTVRSAQKAFERLATHEFDAVVVDYQMPKINGLQMLEKLRKDGNQIPIIIFTGRGREEVAMQALNLGADFYVKKGDDAASAYGELAHKIRQVVDFRRTEAALLRSEERYRQTFDAIRDPAYIWERQANGIIMTQANQAAIALTQGAILEIVGEKLDRFSSDDELISQFKRAGMDSREIYANVNHTLNSGEAIREEIRYTPRTGEARMLSVSYSKAGEERVLVITKDITDLKKAQKARDDIHIVERKKAEEALQRRSEAEKLLTTISTGFINLTSEEIDTGINYTLELLGEFAGADFFSLFLLSGKEFSCTHTWQAEGVQSIQDSWQNLKIENYPWIIDQFDRQKVILVPSVSAMLQGEGSAENFEAFNSISALGVKNFVLAPLIRGSVLTGFLGFASLDEDKVWQEEHIVLLRMAGETFANALERRKSEELLRRQKEELSEFAHAMAHDLRNYTLAIQGYADLLKKNYNKGYAEKIDTLAKGMHELLRRSVSLADAGLIAEKTDEVNLNVLVKTVADAIIPASIAFVQDDLPTVLGDQQKLSEVFQNLFENAVTHGKPNKIQVRREDSEDGISILISNDGIELLPENRSMIFTRRFTTKEEGGGLGMEIIQKVLSAHSWEINLKPDSITTFEIFIPKDA